MHILYATLNSKLTAEQMLIIIVVPSNVWSQLQVGVNSTWTAYHVTVVIYYLYKMKLLGIQQQEGIHWHLDCTKVKFLWKPVLYLM